MKTPTITLHAAVVIGGLVLAGLGGGSAASRLLFADRSPTAVPVDTELVVAVDVSNSMDREEQKLQREGYITGLTSREFMQAIQQGTHGKVAVTYVEWAGLYDQKIVMPWRLIDGPQSAFAVAEEIARAPYRNAPRTSIYGALLFAKPLFQSSGYNGLRRVIDVSGDGVNNMGPSAALMRNDVVESGITINGLPIMLQRPYGRSSDANLDLYYEDCVIGGPGSFMVVIQDREQFKEATRTKLVLEIAGRNPPARIMPAQARAPRVFCS
jgi:hypothetical protein